MAQELGSDDAEKALVHPRYASLVKAKLTITR
jgi:hypothetical protein